MGGICTIYIHLKDCSLECRVQFPLYENSFNAAEPHDENYLRTDDRYHVGRMHPLFQLPYEWRVCKIKGKRNKRDEQENRAINNFTLKSVNFNVKLYSVH